MESYPGEWLCRISELSKWFRTRFQHQALDILNMLEENHLITYLKMAAVA